MFVTLPLYNSVLYNWMWISIFLRVWKYEYLNLALHTRGVFLYNISPPIYTVKPGWEYLIFMPKYFFRWHHPFVCVLSIKCYCTVWQIQPFRSYILGLYQYCWPPLWSSGQSFWLQVQRSRVRFPALPDFLSSSGSGTGSTQPREVNWGATWIKSSGSGPENRD